MKLKRLGNICEVRNGYAFKSNNFNKQGVPIIRISDINNNLVDVSKAVRIKYNQVFENFKIEKGDILIAMSGATTGKFGIYVSDEIAYQNQRVGCFKITNLQILSYPYLLQSLKILKPQIEKKAYGGGQPNISAKNIADLKIPVPSLLDQLHIANILTKTENLITQRKESIRLLDEYLKSTFLEMFGGIAKPKYKTDIIEKYIIKITDGTHQSPKFIEAGVPFLLVSNIINNEIDYNAKKFISENDYRELNKRTPIEIGDILLTSVGSYGNPAMVKTITKFAFQRHIAYIKPDRKKINNVYLFGALKSDFVKNQIDRVVRGVAQLTLNLSDLKRLEIPIPPLIIQYRFAQIVEKTEAVKAKFQKSLKELENLYGCLSQRAFKGELKAKEENLMMAAEPEVKYK